MQNIWQHIYAAFIEADRWKLYLKGLGVTLEVSFFAALLGILIGTIAAFLKLSTRKNGSKTIASRIASAYIDIIRGTPTTVQLLIMWSGILATCKNSVLIASLTFGINSGAYVAEIVRAGILAVDKGQMEAGRSLGLNKFQTMRYIIIPQAFKSILPPLGNEFIVLIKETSIVGYVGMSDLTRVANQMTSKLFDVFYRSDPARKNPAGGSGLGLAIAARAVQSMGGTIRAFNVPGGGLAIEITLPKEEHGDAEDPDYRG